MKRLKRKLQPLQNREQPLVIMGLGNPGPAYTETRHNVGFLCVEGLAEKEGVTFKKQFLKPYMRTEFIYNEKRVILIKPLTFMNRSGLILDDLVRKYGLIPERLLVVVDNMDLKPGVCRFKLKGSTAGHNGLKSLVKEGRCGNFMRLYIGVGRPGSDTTIVDHVLGVPDGDERRSFDRGIESAVSGVYTLLEKTASEAMNEINRKTT